MSYLNRARFLRKTGDLPVINGDGTFSRDFTCVESVIQANEFAATVGKEAVNTVSKYCF